MYWVIEEGRVDPAVFFHQLAAHFPQMTTLFFEGTSIAPAVGATLAAHIDSGPHLPGRQTVHPVSATFRCKASASLFAKLEALSTQHAVPEIADHVYAYADSVELVGFPDFCANEIYLSASTAERTVQLFASALRLKYWKREDG
jgi:hypothetical protein